MKTIMSLSAMALLLFSVVALGLLVHRACRLRRLGMEKAWLPMELRDATLVYAEQVFRTTSPVPIVARLDRGYRNEDDVIILVELKTRRVNRPYFSDVIELSAQRLAVQQQTGERVANDGYVVIQRADGKDKSAHRVVLLFTEAIIAVAKRREAILAGEVAAQYASSEGLCARCAFKLKCKQRADPWM
jgi:hypothetical protein